MQFYLPSKFNKETTPIPTNPDLEITTITGGYYAVIKYSGRSSDKNFEKHSEILREKLLEDKISIKGSAIKATYNSPFTLPFLRRNEAMFSIDWKN
jgi:DNA gyrase inhibitor GyrI